MSGVTRYAVIGRSEGEPKLYHLTETLVRAEWLRKQREEATGEAYYVALLSVWQANPLTALQRAERAATPPP